MAAEERLEKLKQNPFLDGPTQFLCKEIAAKLREVKQFKLIFGEAVDAYERTDFSIRDLPALRCYNHGYQKEHESHYITGDVVIDIVLPPAIRRDELQNIPDVLSAALVQQFRREPFFEAMRSAVPGLNILGQTVAVDKTMAMQWQDELLPVVEMRLNFRVDLKEWDAYLERESRTKDDPFQRTLEELQKIIVTVDALKDDNATTAVELSIDTTGG